MKKQARLLAMAAALSTALTTALTAALTAALVTPAQAFDGWAIESAVNVPGQGSSWDYLTLDEPRQHLFIGHRGEGLKVIDLRSGKLIKVIEHTQIEASNGATLMPAFDLGVSNNQDGSLTPFKLSTLEARSPIRLAEGLDNSHYDPATQRLVVTLEAAKGAGTDLLVLQVPALTEVGRITLPSRKPEHADADGKGNLYMAARDVDTVFRIDLRRLEVTAAWPTPGCAQTNGLGMDVANNRLFLGCRGRDKVKPSFAVMDAASGVVIYTSEIGGGNDGLVYDHELKRIFLSNGVNAVLNIFEQVDADTYRPLEAVGTRANMRTIAMDTRMKKIYAFTAQGSADYAKPVLTSVSPFYANTFFPGTFTLLTFARRP